MPKSPDEPIVKPTVEARQGEGGRDVRNMLLISAGSAAVALAMVYIYFFG